VAVNVPEILAMLRDAAFVPGNLTADSRAVRAGDLFLAYPGHDGRTDGRAYISQAIAAGAGAVLWERDGFDWRADWRLPNAGVPGLKPLAGPLASAIYGAPSRALETIGVTGTNGKTSVTQWIAQALGLCATPCGVIGTLGARFTRPAAAGVAGAAMEEAVPNTTPDAIVLQRLLARMVEAGATACAMEVSSIGLDQGRTDGVEFDTAVFTNFTRDHLDYHGDMAAYEAAKTRLFLHEGLGHAVVNLDDPMGLRLLMRMPAAVARIGYGIEGASAAADAVYDEARLTAIKPRFGAAGVEFELASDWGRATVAAPVWGMFNVSNLLAVAGTLLASGAPMSLAVDALSRLTAVPGRMNALGGDAAPLVVVDYAHTPDALEKALAALRPLAAQRGGALAVVFGCGGERDAGKRPLMGAAAERLADHVILTSDNPRGEDPQAILDQVGAGAPRARRVIDRRAAIEEAVMRAGAADVLLIAGKGHETTQETGGTRLPFSDHEVARKALQDRASTSHGERR
jgi:UDP-N-acetylmuramoyl-L-alanyl-D-glutamate--2,6-diaminopimelate ligase